MYGWTDFSLDVSMCGWIFAFEQFGWIGAILVHLEASSLHAGTSWRPFGISWEHVGHILGHVGVDFGAWKESLTRFAEILKNHEKRCKVLQKSRFGGSDNQEIEAWRTSLDQIWS